MNSNLKFCFTLSKFQTELSRRFDSKLNGISLNELIILFNLSKSPDEKMKRIDLANKIGLTASGITRLLLPMEKIGLISKETNERDARVSFVKIAPGGKEKLNECLERAEIFLEEIIPQNEQEDLEKTINLIQEISKNLLLN